MAAGDGNIDATARSPFGQAYTALYRLLTEQIRALIARLQALGLVRQDIDGAALGELIFNSMDMMFIEFVKRDEAGEIAVSASDIFSHAAHLLS